MPDTVHEYAVDLIHDDGRASTVSLYATFDPDADLDAEVEEAVVEVVTFVESQYDRARPVQCCVVDPDGLHVAHRWYLNKARR